MNHPICNISERKFSKKHSNLKSFHIVEPTEFNFDFLKKDLKYKKCIYLIRFRSGIKIGISADFGRRINAYTKPWCYKILEIFIISIPLMSSTIEQVENALKRKYGYKIKGSSEFISDYNFNHIKGHTVNMLKSYLKRELKENYIPVLIY